MRRRGAGEGGGPRPDSGAAGRCSGSGEEDSGPRLAPDGDSAEEPAPAERVTVQ